MLVISPVRNEAAHLELVARAVAAQTRPPDAWVLVDDASTDETLAIARRLEGEIEFLRVVELPPRPADANVRDRLAAAAAPRGFNAGLHADGEPFDFVMKLDGDIELPPDYLELMLARFAAEPSLGLAGARLAEDHDGTDRLIPIPDDHVHGAVKLYRLGCFLAIGGVRETLGWDTIDETYARLNGWRAVSFRDVVARHHRNWGTADGVLRGRARHGVCAYICNHAPAWVLLRAVKIAAERPRGLSGGAFLFGYLRAAATRTSRIEDPDFRRQIRREQRGRVRGALTTVRLARR